jgi:hypothetical protein
MLIESVTKYMFSARQQGSLVVISPEPIFESYDNDMSHSLSVLLDFFKGQKSDHGSWMGEYCSHLKGQCHQKCVPDQHTDILFTTTLEGP